MDFLKSKMFYFVFVKSLNILYFSLYCLFSTVNIITHSKMQTIFTNLLASKQKKKKNECSKKTYAVFVLIYVAVNTPDQSR